MEYAETNDMYVFARDTDPDLVRNAPKDPNGVVRYLAQITGDYSSLAVVETDGLEIQRVASDLFAPPTTQLADPDTSKPIRFGAAIVKRSLWLAESAFMRIGVRGGMATQVLEAANDVDGYSASAIVLGNYDVLLELGADTRRELYERILAATRIDGVAWSRTHVVLDWWHRDHGKPAAS
jgi:hypothetical protein